jgi:predicted RNA-binding Zn ribbon-like protein
MTEHEHDTDRPAPGELWRVQRLINTFDLEHRTDALTGAWLVEHELAASETVDLAPVREFREALRSLLLAHNGEPVDADAVLVLSALSREAGLAVAFSEDGTPRLGAAGPVGRALAIIAAASADGTWERLKVCPADDCLWAFYDFSRNHSRTWCSMSSCGNRAKARAYRSRQPKASA